MLRMIWHWLCSINWRYCNSLKFNGPARGCYPEPTKIIMIVHPNNLEAGELFGVHRGFKVCTGARYLGGYIRDNESKFHWIQNWAEKRERSISVITKTAGKYPQESYAAVARVIQ